MSPWQDEADAPDMRSRRWERWVGPRAVGLLLLLLLVALRGVDPDPVQLVRARIFDLYQSLLAPQAATTNVVLVDIDEDSLQRVGQWPWSRAIMADLVDILAENGAAVVGFDMMFPEPDRASPARLADELDALPPEMRRALQALGDNDTRFADAMRRVPVVLGYTLRPDIGPVQTERPPLTGRVAVLGNAPIATVPNYPAAIRNIAPLEAAAAGLGLVNTAEEPDGAVRRIPMVMRIDGGLQPSLVSEVLRVAHDLSGIVLHADRLLGVESIGFGGYRLPTDARGRVWINFHSGRNPVRVSAHALLDGSADPAVVRDRIVLVGSSALAVGDIWPTSAAGPASGVEIQARIVDNLLAGATVLRPGYAEALEIAIVLLAGLYLLWSLRRRSVQGKLLVFLALAAAILVASAAAYAFAWTLLDPTYPIAACLVILLYLGYRDFRQEERMLAVQQARLHRTDAFMRRIVDNSFDAILSVDGRGRILTANPAARALIGGDCDPAGQPFQSMLRRETPEGDGTVTDIATLFEEGAVSAWLQVRDGSRRAVELTVRPMRDGPADASIVVMRDVTARKQAEAAARRALDRLHDAIESIPEGFALVDRDGVLALCNRRFAAMVGAAGPEGAAGRPFRDVLHDWVNAQDGPLGVSEQVEDWLAACEGRLRAAEVPRELATRGGHWLRIAGQPTSDGGTVALFSDIDDLKEREVQLERENLRAEQASAAKSQFLANVSHELRTPLNAIIGFSEVMHSGMFGPIENAQYSDYVSSIHESSQFLLHLIDDLIDLSKFELGGSRIEEADVDVAVAISGAISMVRLQAEQGGIALETQIESGLAHLHADRTMVRQIVLNLLTNAIKFTPRHGHVGIIARRAADGGMEIAVSDTGPGVPKDVIPRMTEPFWRSEDALIRDHPGVGLGLSLVASFVTRHNGTLVIDSELGEGTTVTVRFPASRVLQDASGA